jgi:ATP-dependent helicase/DNAse subunit B
MAVVRIVSGPAGSGKTDRLRKQYRQVARSAPGAALWIGPTYRSVEAVRPELLTDLDGSLAPYAFTFQDFAEEIIRVNDPTARPLAQVQRRLLADDLVARLHAKGQLSHFQRIVDTRGFAEAVFAFFAELKRSEIWPEHLEDAIARRAAASPRHRQCLLLYTEYQNLLIRHHLYDLEGRFWYARDLLSRDQRQPFEAVQAVFVDGFLDFTRVQQEILVALGRWVSEIWISLPDETGDERAELFSRPRATCQRLQLLQPQIEYLPRLADAFSAGLAHVERQLFRPVRKVEQGADACGIVCIEAPGPLGETRLVAREIKELILAGVPAEDILVTLRELAGYGDLIAEVFAEYGIPVDIEGIEPLARNPAVSRLLRAFRLRDDDWPFAATMALLRSDYFDPNWPEKSTCPNMAQRAEALLRLLGEPRGRVAYLEAVDRWADDPPRALEDEQAQEQRRRKTHDLATLCRPFLRRFFAAWEDIPVRGTPSTFARALRQFAEDMGLVRAARYSRDTAALARLWQDLEQWIELERKLKGADVSCDAGQFGRMLSALTAEAGLARTPRGPGRVRILSAPLARNLSVPYLFVMGLGERSFPRLSAPEPFFEEAERQSFRQAGLDFPCQSDLMPDEMLLFYQVVTRARRQLVLSYPAVDDKGQALLPGSFLQTLLECFEPKVLIPRRQRMLIEGYNRIGPLSPAEYRVRIAWNVERGASAKSALQADLAANLAAARRMARLRLESKEFNPYDGLLRHGSVVGELERQFGPDKVFSPTALENYIACPFRFFLEQVLRLEALEEPREEIENTQRGRAVHRALSRLHRQLQAEGIQQPTEVVDALLRRQLDEAVAEYALRSHPAAQALWNLEGQRLGRLALRYRPQWEKFVGPWRANQVVPEPRFFETGFGMPPEEGEEPLGPLVLNVDGIEVRLRGRIDRVDVAQLEDGLGFWIIDYKTGRSTHYRPEDLQSFERLQLMLYALAVERVLLAGHKARPLGMAYWLVADGGPKPAMPHKARELVSWLSQSGSWHSVRAQLERWVVTLAANIRRGAFPLKPRDDNCTAMCPYGQVCRITQARSVGKAWDLASPLPEHRQQADE